MKTLKFALATTAAMGIVPAAHAATVTPDIIFGSGNANGGFTVVNPSVTAGPASGTVELGLRAKLRYDLSGNPQNTFKFDGVDTYSFDLANGNPPANRAMWNFEWSINVSNLLLGGSPTTIAELAAAGSRLDIEFDIDPGVGTTFVTYDAFAADAYYGTDATPNGGGTYDSSGTPVAGATVAQNSVNYGFIPGAPLGPGTYDIRMTGTSFGGVPLASTAITVNVAPIPLPASVSLMLAGLGGLAFAARRKRRASTTA